MPGLSNINRSPNSAATSLHLMLFSLFVALLSPLAQANGLAYGADPNSARLRGSVAVAPEYGARLNPDLDHATHRQLYRRTLDREVAYRNSRFDYLHSNFYGHSRYGHGRYGHFQRGLAIGFGYYGRGYYGSLSAAYPSNRGSSYYGGRHHDRFYDDHYHYYYDDHANRRDISATAEGGWKLLQAGRSEAALQFFSRQAGDNPRVGRPEVGYALSSALRGSFGQAAWALRRAMEYDPSALAQVPMTAAMQNQIRAVVRDLEQRQYPANAEAARKRDQAFLLSCLHYVLGEYRQGLNAAYEAQRHGDRSPGVRNLSGMLSQRV